MSIIDALRKGVDLSNASMLGRIEAAKLPYASGNAQEEYLKNLYYNQMYKPNIQSQIDSRNSSTRNTNIRNEYLPEELRLGNEHQGEVNQMYIPAQQAEIRHKNELTRLLPLNSAIDAQKALVNNERFSQARDFVRSVNSMNKSQQAIYLSDPNNSAAYDAALNDVQQAINTQGRANLLHPDFLKKFGLASPAMPPPGVMNRSAPMMQPGSAPMNPAMQNGSVGPNAPQQNAPIPSASPGNTEQFEPTDVNHPNSPTYISPQERTALNRRNLVNQQNAGAAMWNRANSAVALENFVFDNRVKYAPRIRNAIKYAGILRKGKEVSDAFSSDPKNSQALDDYMWYTTQFVPNLSNNIKQMERLSSSAKQREELAKMSNYPIESYLSNPERAMHLINKNLDTIHDESTATLKAAQQSQPGVIERLNGWVDKNGKSMYDKSQNYLDQKMVTVIDPDGREMTGPEDKVQDLLKKFKQFKLKAEKKNG